MKTALPVLILIKPVWVVFVEFGQVLARLDEVSRRLVDEVYPDELEVRVEDGSAPQRMSSQEH